MSEWILLQSGLVIYIALSLMLLGGAIGLPIPEDVTLILGGILANRGNANVGIVLAVCYIGSVVGDVIIFFAGQKLARGLSSKEAFKNKFPGINFTELKQRLEKRRFLMILLARHLFYMRTVTFLACGAMKMDFRRFLFADAGAALISVPVMFMIGYLGSENYSAIVAFLSRIKLITGVFCLLLIVGAILYLKKHRNRSSQSNNSSD